MEDNNMQIPVGWEENNFASLTIERPKSQLKVSDATGFGNYLFFTSGEAVLIHHKKQIEGENIFLATGGVANVKYHNGEVSYSTDTYALTSDNASLKYLYYYLLNKLYYIDSNYFLGSGLKHLQKKDLKSHSFILPKSITEQKKIAEILSKVDTAIEQTQSLIAKYQRIKTGLMQDLLTKGIYESGNKFIKTDLKNICINRNFSLATLGAHTEVRQGYQIAISSRKKEEGKNRFVYITVQYLNNPDKYLEFIENPPKSVVSSKEDILFIRTGNTGQIVSGIVGVYHNNFFKVDFNKDVITKDYLLLFLQWKPVQDLILELAGTTTIPDLKHRDFYSIPFFFPKDKNEQIKISNIINKNSDKILVEQTKLQKLQSIKTGLMQDLLSGKKRVTKLIKEKAL